MKMSDVFQFLSQMNQTGDSLRVEYLFFASFGFKGYMLSTVIHLSR